MLGGLLLHGTLAQEPRPLFTLIALVSHSFRMGCFLAISGYLGGMSLGTRPPRSWLVRRLVQIGLPAAFGLAVICPLVGELVRLRPASLSGGPPLPYDWYHLWFLVALLIYAPAAFLAHRLEPRHRLVERFTASFCTSRRSLLPMLLTLSALSFLLMLAAASAVGALAPVRWVASLDQCRLIAGYLPLYLLGFAMASSRELRDAARRAWRSALLVVVLTAAIYAGWFGLIRSTLPVAEREWLDGLVQIVGAALCPPAAFLLIFRSAAGVRRTPPLLHRLCEASLTIYLVHVPLMVGLNLMLRTNVWNPYLEYAITVTVGGLLSYFVHVAIVRPVPLLMLVVNGRINAWRAKPRLVDEARHHFAIGAADLHLRA